MVLSRVFTEAERASVVDGYGSWSGTQAAYAASLGIPNGTVSKWLSGERGAQGTHRKAGPPPRATGPTMLEVVAREPIPDTRPVAAIGGIRLGLGGGVELTLESLPPASWVAELASALRRC